jgi:hypothetical protein
VTTTNFQNEDLATLPDGQAVAWNSGAVDDGTQRVILATNDPAVSVLGTTAGAAVITDATGTIQQYLRGLVKLLITSGTIVLGAGTNAIGKLAANAGVDIGDVGAKSYALAGAGELAGSASAVQMPTLTCKLVKFKASYDNAGRVYIGGSSVTVANGSTDTTTGLQLSAGEETGWLPVANVNAFYRITDNTTDDLTYIALV